MRVSAVTIRHGFSGLLHGDAGESQGWASRLTGPPGPEAPLVEAVLPEGRPMVRPERECECLRTGPLPDSRACSYLGIDPGAGRFAEVEIEECTLCRRRWLHYEMGGANSAAIGRWFRGVLPERMAEGVTAATSLAVLASLEWYLQGGAWFGNSGERSSGPPHTGE